MDRFMGYSESYKGFVQERARAAAKRAVLMVPRTLGPEFADLSQEEYVLSMRGQVQQYFRNVGTGARGNAPNFLLEALPDLVQPEHRELVKSLLKPSAGTYLWLVEKRVANSMVSNYTANFRLHGEEASLQMLSNENLEPAYKAFKGLPMTAEENTRFCNFLNSLGLKISNLMHIYDRTNPIA